MLVLRGDGAAGETTAPGAAKARRAERSCRRSASARSASGRTRGLLEYPPESFVGYRLLQEYFTFPDKFLFVDLTGLAAVTRGHAGRTLDLHVLLRQTPAQLDARVEVANLKLGCTPAVNLFPPERRSDPAEHNSVEYPLVPRTSVGPGLVRSPFDPATSRA